MAERETITKPKATHGGRRPGAGRKVGSTSSKTAQAWLDAVEADKTGTLFSPLSFLLKTMVDKKLPLDLRINCARIAAPFLHPKLQVVSSDKQTDNKLVVQMINHRDVAIQFPLGDNNDDKEVIMIDDGDRNDND